mgnify:CR=1 FL=1
MHVRDSNVTLKIMNEFRNEKSVTEESENFRHTCQ